jgi:hypothetical protein
MSVPQQRQMWVVPRESSSRPKQDESFLFPVIFVRLAPHKNHKVQYDDRKIE